MKKVISGDLLKDKMVGAVNLLCDTVKITLGPKGSNVIIDHSTFSPFITNDGVTIASSIESDDEVTNTILELAKEASLKTNENVGDGTTTTLVLLQSIFNDGVKLVRDGVNPLILKKELDEVTLKIDKLLKEKAHIPSDEELINIACISSNDEEIGEIVGETYLKVRDRLAISIKEGDSDNTTVNYLNGYIIETILASPYFMNNLNKLKLDNPYLLIIENYLEDLENLANIINIILKEKRPIIILASDYDSTLVQNILEINQSNDTKIILLKTPDYGVRGHLILEDLEVISGAKIVYDLDNILPNCLGTIDRIVINEDKSILSFKNNAKIKKQITKLESELINTLDKEYYQKRISMFKNGMAEILVGARTVTERREAKMRFDDALWAIDVASKGVIPGSGITLSYISSLLDENSNGSKIIKEALLKPFEQVIQNAALDYQEIFTKIKNSDYDTLYNVKNDKYENIKNTIVIDPLEVVINTIHNAVSIAGILLTTTSLVINEQESTLNKINNYNEM